MPRFVAAFDSTFLWSSKHGLDTKSGMDRIPDTSEQKGLTVGDIDFFIFATGDIIRRSLVLRDNSGIHRRGGGMI